MTAVIFRVDWLLVIPFPNQAPNGPSDRIEALASGGIRAVPQRNAAGHITGYQWGQNTEPFVPAVTQTWQRGPGGRIDAAGSNLPPNE